MREQFNEMVNILVEIMEREDLPKAIAKFYYRLGSALLEEGFSEDATLELLKVIAIPATTKS